MSNSNDGSCRTCAHFGDGVPSEQLVQIRIENQPDTNEVLGGCDLPANAALHLKVSPLSSCDGYQPLEAA
ncbi:MAG: hypothetical protein VX527_06795 [Planctomycetota bacterium]|nr:hypothetical protein [Planctomycetota bacterium]